MFQWLTGGCAWVGAFNLVGAIQLSLFRCVLLVLLGFQGTNIAVAGTSAPIWTVPVSLTSDDGYAFLDWTLPVGQSAKFFRITETFKKRVTVHYTETNGLRAWRVEPGEYQFTLQACVKSSSGVPECGGPSEVLTLDVSNVVQSASLAEVNDKSNQVVYSTSSDGGPDQLRPGSWSNLRKAGHGWHFYWANRLALPENDPLFGTGYDLVGVWLTYEAKDAQADPDCPECQPVADQYLPIAVNLKAVSIGPDTFGGSLYISRSDDSEVWIGGIEIEFTFYNYQAIISWNANFKKESLSDTESLNFSAGPEPLQPSGISHLSGLWSYTG